VADTEKNIFIAVREILKLDATLLPYLAGRVYDGIRENVTEGGLPAIVLEPDSTSEEPGSLTRRHILRPRILIGCYMEHYNFDLQIVGGLGVKGIYEFVADVKNALDVYPQLNYDATTARLDFFRFPDTRYEFELFPLRIAQITFEGQVLTAGASR